MSDLLLQISPAWPVIIAGLLAAIFPIHEVRKGLALAAPIAAGALWPWRRQVIMSVALSNLADLCSRPIASMG